MRHHLRRADMRSDVNGIRLRNCLHVCFNDAGTLQKNRSVSVFQGRKYQADPCAGTGTEKRNAPCIYITPCGQVIQTPPRVGNSVDVQFTKLDGPAVRRGIALGHEPLDVSFKNDAEYCPARLSEGCDTILHRCW